VSRISKVWLEREPLLGTAPDLELAERWGVSKQRVHQVRVALGVPAFTPKVDWDLIDAVLRRRDATYRAVAEAYGLNVSTIYKRCDAIGIPHSSPSDHEYGREEYYASRDSGSAYRAAHDAGSCASTYSRRAKAYAARNGLKWPFGRAPKDIGSAEAYRLFMEEGLRWSVIAKRVGYGGGESARVAASRHAKRGNKPAPTVRNRRNQ